MVFWVVSGGCGCSKGRKVDRSLKEGLQDARVPTNPQSRLIPGFDVPPILFLFSRGNTLEACAVPSSWVRGMMVGSDRRRFHKRTVDAPSLTHMSTFGSDNSNSRRNAFKFFCSLDVFRANGGSRPAMDGLDPRMAWAIDGWMALKATS